MRHNKLYIPAEITGEMMKMLLPEVLMIERSRRESARGCPFMLDELHMSDCGCLWERRFETSHI